MLEQPTQVADPDPDPGGRWVLGGRRHWGGTQGFSAVKEAARN